MGPDEQTGAGKKWKESAVEVGNVAIEPIKTKKKKKKKSEATGATPTNAAGDTAAPASAPALAAAQMTELGIQEPKKRRKHKKKGGENPTGEECHDPSQQAQPLVATADPIHRAGLGKAKEGTMGRATQLEKKGDGSGPNNEGQKGEGLVTPNHISRAPWGNISGHPRGPGGAQGGSSSGAGSHEQLEKRGADHALKQTAEGGKGKGGKGKKRQHGALGAHAQSMVTSSLGVPGSAIGIPALSKPAAGGQPTGSASGAKQDEADAFGAPLMVGVAALGAGQGSSAAALSLGTAQNEEARPGPVQGASNGEKKRKKEPRGRQEARTVAAAKETEKLPLPQASLVVPEHGGRSGPEKKKKGTGGRKRKGGQEAGKVTQEFSTPGTAPSAPPAPIASVVPLAASGLSAPVGPKEVAVTGAGKRKTGEGRKKKKEEGGISVAANTAEGGGQGPPLPLDGGLIPPSASLAVGGPKGDSTADGPLKKKQKKGQASAEAPRLDPAISKPHLPSPAPLEQSPAGIPAGGQGGFRSLPVAASGFPQSLPQSSQDLHLSEAIGAFSVPGLPIASKDGSKPGGGSKMRRKPKVDGEAGLVVPSAIPGTGTAAEGTTRMVVGSAEKVEGLAEKPKRKRKKKAEEEDRVAETQTLVPPASLLETVRQAPVLVPTANESANIGLAAPLQAEGQNGQRATPQPGSVKKGVRRPPKKAKATALAEQGGEGSGSERGGIAHNGAGLATGAGGGHSLAKQTPAAPPGGPVADAPAGLSVATSAAGGPKPGISPPEVNQALAAGRGAAEKSSKDAAPAKRKLGRPPKKDQELHQAALMASVAAADGAHSTPGTSSVLAGAVQSSHPSIGLLTQVQGAGAFPVAGSAGPGAAAALLQDGAAKKKRGWPSKKDLELRKAALLASTALAAGVQGHTGADVAASGQTPSQAQAGGALPLAAGAAGASLPATGLPESPAKKKRGRPSKKDIELRQAGLVASAAAINASGQGTPQVAGLSGAPPWELATGAHPSGVEQPDSTPKKPSRPRKKGKAAIEAGAEADAPAAAAAAASMSAAPTAAASVQHGEPSGAPSALVVGRSPSRKSGTPARAKKVQGPTWQEVHAKLMQELYIPLVGHLGALEDVVRSLAPPEAAGAKAGAGAGTGAGAAELFLSLVQVMRHMRGWTEAFEKHSVPERTEQSTKTLLAGVKDSVGVLYHALQGMEHKFQDMVITVPTTAGQAPVAIAATSANVVSERGTDANLGETMAQPVQVDEAVDDEEVEEDDDDKEEEEESE